jgi:hypothetical protein
MLPVETAANGPSEKGYGQRDLDDIMSRVPDVYGCLAAGATPAQLLAARSQPDPRQRQLGETYANLFGRYPGAQTLAAEWDGGALQVTKGRHRIEAARRLGIPVVPIVVSGRTEADLAELDQRFDAKVGSSYSAYRRVHAAERGQGAPQPQPVQVRERGDM